MTSRNPILNTLPRPIFVTFYSFKGGVGRTMALANVAAILAGRGRRVLMIDFDLEAPGLTLLARKELAAMPDQNSAGLVELVHDFLSDPDGSPLSDSQNQASFRDHYVCSLPIPEHVQKAEGGCLDLMPCGRLDDTYERRLHQIQFDRLYQEGVGKPLF